MKHGFIKVGTAGIATVVADVRHNTCAVCEQMKKAAEAGVRLLVFPELVLTGYTCGDLFYSETLLSSIPGAIEAVLKESAENDMVTVIGAPIRFRSKLYNCAVAVQSGRILGVVPKRFLPNYNEFYEMRQFSSGNEIPDGTELTLCGSQVPFGTDLLFAHSEMADYVFGIELCEDLWAPVPPCEKLCMNGATVMLNLSASTETVGKEDYRRLLVTSVSARLLCAYLYTSSGEGESTQDVVFSSHALIAENGAILKETKPFENECAITVAEIDVQRLAHDRHKNTSFVPANDAMRRVVFEQAMVETELTRTFAANPFVPANPATLYERAETILSIQAHGLKKRLAHTHCHCAVIGVSGGLDSTLALLVAAKAMDLLGQPRTDILAVTMPCFGTTKRTHDNAADLCKALGAELMEVPIADAVRVHFRDIGHDESVTDVTYENCQARERTQVLMDLANKRGGMVIGTGDLSELALGWATYNGDHMSMYGVNTSVPKTLVRFIVRHVADRDGGDLAKVLYDILDTPVSPELLPVDKDGNMTQKTEDLVGPYELHDFFLYYVLRFGFDPDKIYCMARQAFNGAYDDATIRKWLRTFMRRFFMQQFKRSCLPDGPKVGSAALSPRGDWRMPSDASGALWLDSIGE